MVDPESCYAFAPSGVTAKMVCVKLEQSHGQKGGLFRLSPVMGTSLENRTFWDASPSGEFWISTSNPAAFRYFQLGEEYRIRIEHVPEVDRLRGELEFKEAEIASLRKDGKYLGGWAPGKERADSEIASFESTCAALRDRIRELEARSA